MTLRPTDERIVCHGPTPAAHRDLATIAGIAPALQDRYRVRLVREIVAIRDGEVIPATLEVGEVFFSPEVAALVSCRAVVAGDDGLPHGLLVAVPTGVRGMAEALFTALGKPITISLTGVTFASLAGQRTRWN